MRMLAALMLSQTLLVRASIVDSVELQRFCVLVPSVRITMTLSRSVAKAGALNGATGQPLFDTELIHGDRFHVTDIDPDRPGFYPPLDDRGKQSFP